MQIDVFRNPLEKAGRLEKIFEKAERLERLNKNDLLELYVHASLFELGYLARKRIPQRMAQEKIVTYVADRNINYSNICVCGCKFCAFFKAPLDSGGYVIERDQLKDKIEETFRLGGTQILLQGGHHPGLSLEWYEDLLAWMRKNWPDLHIHAFSPPEIFFWSKQFGLPVEVILKRLMAAGLDSIPGGGAEILVNEERKRVSPNKCSADQWLMVMEKAHNLGMRTTATMMFGHGESIEARISHLLAVRTLQDKTGGFTAFIPWSFQPANTAIDVFEQPAPVYLRLLAICRLALDNIENLQASWVTMGAEIAQLALHYGANDFGSLMIEENVVAAAGVSFRLSRKDIHASIRYAGFIPRQRKMDYSLIETGYDF